MPELEPPPQIQQKQECRFPQFAWWIVTVKDLSEPREWVVVYQGMDKSQAESIAKYWASFSSEESRNQFGSKVGDIVEVYLFNAILKNRWGPESP